MNKLESRIAKLEQAAGNKTPWQVLLVRFVGAKEGHPMELAPLYGYGTLGANPTRTIRRQGETDDELEARAIAAVKLTIAPGSGIVLEELRGDTP